MSAVFKRLLSYVGKVKLKDLPPDWQQPVHDALTKLEKKDSRVKQAEIKGSNPHKSHSDPNDPEDVISVRLLKDSGSRVDSVHVHKDGSTTSKRD